MSAVDKGTTTHWQSGDDAVNRLREFTIEEVSIVDRPANKRPFLVRKQEDSMSGKTQVSVALKSMTAALEKTALLVSTLKGDVAGPALVELSTTAQLLGKDLKSIGTSYPTFKFEGDAVVSAPEATKVAALQFSTDALERMTAVVTTLKAAAEIDDEAFAAVARDIATISNLLSQVGNTAPVVATTKTEEVPPAPAGVVVEAPPASPVVEAAIAVTAPTETAAIAAVPAAATAVADAQVPTAPTTEQIVEAAEAAATAADGAAVGEVTKASVARVAKMLENTYFYANVGIDSYDPESLKAVIDALVSILGDEEAVTKRASSLMKGVATELRTIAKTVKETSKMDVSLVKRVASVKALVTKVADVVPAETVAAPVVVPAPVLDAAAVQQMIEATVEAAVAKTQVAKAENAKLTADNEKLRAELAKKNAEPVVTRASSPEVVPETVEKTDMAKLFPTNYNSLPVD